MKILLILLLYPLFILIMGLLSMLISWLMVRDAELQEKEKNGKI